MGRPKLPPKSCTIGDCAAIAIARGWCKKHWQRWSKGKDIHQNPSVVKKSEHLAEYHAWEGMRARCRNANSPRYADYGGRGIQVCDRWRVGEHGKHPFQCFFEDMGERPSRKHSVDRKDNDGDYCPENCQWATKQQQANNTRRNRYVELEGQTKTIAQWCAIKKVSYDLVKRRLYYGWAFTDAIAVPVIDARSRYLGRERQP